VIVDDHELTSRYHVEDVTNDVCDHIGHAEGFVVDGHDDRQ
jgi:hypothetical protein